MDRESLSNQILTLDDLVLEEILSQLNSEDILSLCLSNALVANKVLSIISTRPTLTRRLTRTLTFETQSLTNRGREQHQVSENDTVASFLDNYELNGSRNLYMLKNGKVLKKFWSFRLNGIVNGDKLAIMAKLRGGPNQNYGDLLEIDDWTRIVNARMTFRVPLLPLDRT